MVTVLSATANQFPAFVPKIAKYINKLGQALLLLFTTRPKTQTNTGNNPRICFPLNPKREQTRASIPAFVYHLTQYVNKHGQKETKAGESKRTKNKKPLQDV